MKQNSLRRVLAFSFVFCVSAAGEPQGDEANDWENAIRTASQLVREAEFEKAEARLKSVLAELGNRNDLTAVVAATWNNLGSVYHDMGKELEAMRCYRRSIQIWERCDEPDEGIARPLNNLALLYKERGRLKDAEELYRRSLALREKTYGREHPALANVMTNLASLRQEMGDSGTAENLYLQALRLLEGAEVKAGDRAAAHNNLGDLYRSRKRFDEAAYHIERAIQLWHEELGAAHPATATGLATLARTYADQRQFSKAEVLLRQSISLIETTLGPDHPDLAPVLERYSNVLRGMGQKKDAKAAGERAKALWDAHSRSNLRQHSLDVSEARRRE